jgi:hypothetical protein
MGVATIKRALGRMLAAVGILHMTQNAQLKQGRALKLLQSITV